MDEFVGVLIVVLAAVVRFVLFLVVEVVWELLLKGVIGGLLWLVWPGGRTAADQEPGEGRRN